MANGKFRAILHLHLPEANGRSRAAAHRPARGCQSQRHRLQERVPIKSIHSRADGGTGLAGQRVRIGGWVKTGHLSKGREEDAHEFMRYTVDAMESICLAEHGMVSDPSEADTNLMGLTFGGYLQSKM